MKLAKSLISTVFIILTAVVAAQSQSNEVQIIGLTTDQNSHPVSGASVLLRQQGINFERETTTDQHGRFQLSVPAAGYLLTVKRPGFSPFVDTVKLDRSQELKVQLLPAAIAESVVITSSHLTIDSEEIERVPGSIDVIDQYTLENARPLNSNEVLRKVAGINVRDEEGFGLRPNLGIRGLNPTRSTKVLLLEDGIPLTYAPYGDNSSYYHPPIDRFEAVEVLKGSGQILYGPQTVGGVINYITRTPPDHRAGSITLTGGSHSYFNGHLNFGDTIGNTGFLLEFTRKQGEGARDNIRSGINDFNFKSITNFSSRQAITLKFNYYGENSNITYSGLREDEFRNNPRQNPFSNDFFYINRFGASLTHAYVFSPDVVLTTNIYGSYFRRHWWRQSSNSNERPNDAADPACGGMANLHTTCGNQGRLRRYVFGGIEPRLRWSHRLFGIKNETDFGFRGHAEDQNRRQENGNTPVARSGVLVEHNERNNQAYSGYIQNRFIFDKLVVTPGLRIENVRYRRTNNLLQVTGRTKLTQVVPGLGFSFVPNQKFTVFAGVHRGFAPPRTEDIINNTTGGSIDLDPELSWNYEVGMRSRLHQAVRVDLTFFRMDYENQIVPASLAGGIGSTFTNGGQTLHQGIEFSGGFDTAPIFKRRFNIYLRGAYTYLPVAEFRGTRFSSVPGFSTTSVTGNRLPYAPAHLLNASVGYAHTNGLDTFIETVYVGSQFADDLNRIDPLNLNGQTGLIPSYTIVNATVNYRVEKMRTTFFITAKNLFDRLYIADRTRGLLPGPGRGIQAGMKFNF